MISLLAEHWREISAAIGGILTFIIGRKSTKFLEKKQQVDAVNTMQKTYDMFMTHYEKEYQLINQKLDKLQNQFIEQSLAYAKEIERSQNWEKLHRELQEKYYSLDKKYQILEKEHDKLKLDFENYKKQIDNSK